MRAGCLRRSARQGDRFCGNWVREMTTMILTSADSGATAVPNGFLDRYLPEADGEYVKIYLLLWRYFCEKKNISIGELADLLDDTEKDVLRGIRYWVKKGLMQVVTNDKKEIYSLRFLPIPEVEPVMPTAQRETAAALESAQGRTATPSKAAAAGSAIAPGSSGTAGSELSPTSAAGKQDASHTISRAKRKELAADEEFGQLVYIVGKYLDRPMKQTDSDVLGYLYGELGMRADLLEYLVESCVDAGHKSIHYIEKIALDWHDKGIRTADDAREQAEICRKQYYQVLNAFGLSKRKVAPEERKVMDLWFYDYGFQLDIVLEACNRTIRNIHEPSFEYAGKILADWKKKGVRSRSDIDALDQAFAKEREAKKNQRGGTAKPNRFHNFDQVGYDYDAIVKELNG